ncbi:LytR C-terminal domain-containing protein [Saccharopolyspora taberi]|uniref:LytR/CpsA/Psr regulator C-terminal domain-containing protein n=1 Tax=Saccharopolyspora taberi TaxID=60895 RepID=A0ABN3VLX4_9PSEU
MTSGEPASGPSKARLAGFGLIGVGVLAAVLGVTTAVSGEPGDTAQPAPPASSAVAEPPGEPRPEVPPQVPSSTAVQPPAAQPPAPQPTSQQPPAPTVVVPPRETGSEQGSPRIVVRVYNNSTIAGLAHRASEDFRRAGYDVPEVGNYSAGRIYTTTIYFRPGTEEEAQAREVAALFGARLEPRFQGIEGASPGVIAIVTNDYKGPAGK